MSRLTRWLDRTWYPGSEKNWDDLLFRELILAQLAPGHAVLDVGAGAGIVAAMNFKGHAARICGIDPDPRVVANPFLDEGKQGVGERIPYDEGSFDVAFADNVLEHLADPEAVFREVARVLKPGGCFLAKTPNKWHYMPVIARLTPHSFHQLTNRLRGRAEVDTFPTLYRANSPSELRRLAQASGLQLESVALHEGRPEYLRMTAPTYLVGWLYERIVNALPALRRFRIVMMVRFRKAGN